MLCMSQAQQSVDVADTEKYTSSQTRREHPTHPRGTDCARGTSPRGREPQPCEGLGHHSPSARLSMPNPLAFLPGEVIRLPSVMLNTTPTTASPSAHDKGRHAFQPTASTLPRRPLPLRLDPRL